MTGRYTVFGAWQTEATGIGEVWGGADCDGSPRSRNDILAILGAVTVFYRHEASRNRLFELLERHLGSP